MNELYQFHHQPNPRVFEVGFYDANHVWFTLNGHISISSHTSSTLKHASFCVRKVFSSKIQTCLHIATD